MEYSQERITHKHYGKYVAHMLCKLRDEENVEATTVAIDSLARYMRAKSYEYNQEHPNNEVIIKDIKKMSEGAIKIDEVALNNLRSEYKQPFSARQTKGPQRPMQKAGAKNGAQKSYNSKNRPNAGLRKNSSDNQMRHNSQK